MSPATSVLTETVIGRVAVSPPSLAVTTIRPSVTVVSPGTFTSRRAVAGLPLATETPDTTKPPPCNVAVHPEGVPDTVRSAVPSRGAVIVRSKLALEPGATAIAGYGVVTARVSAATTAGASPTRTMAERARAIAGRRPRAIRDVGKGPLLQSNASDCGSLPTAAR